MSEARSLQPIPFPCHFAAHFTPNQACYRVSLPQCWLHVTSVFMYREGGAVPVRLFRFPCVGSEPGSDLHWGAATLAGADRHGRDCLRPDPGPCGGAHAATARLLLLVVQPLGTQDRRAPWLWPDGLQDVRLHPGAEALPRGDGALRRVLPGPRSRAEAAASFATAKNATAVQNVLWCSCHLRW